MKLFAVFGSPVLHSQSPQIWNAAFDEFALDARYIRINPQSAAHAIQIMRELRMTGCNVTTPLKTEVVNFLDELDPSAECLQAVNTIKQEDGRLIGYNTDAYGVVNSLKDAGIALHTSKVAVLGAGGAARAAVYGLLQAGTREVALLNRTDHKAQTIAERLGCRAALWSEREVELASADVLVSCLPVTSRVIDKALLHSGLVVFDANYASQTALLQDAHAVGCEVIPALHWLTHQAAAAFRIFFDSDPTPVMRRAFETPLRGRGSSVAIIGFMGAGKTTLGRHLAKMTGNPRLDTDRRIEQRAGKRIPDIFAQDGEDAFRALERAVFAEIDWSVPQIVSCGGGAIKDAEIRAILAKHCSVIWVWSPLETIMTRIRRGTRPLLHVENMEEKAARLFSERIPLYAACADLMCVNAATGARAAAKQVYEEIYRTGRD